MVITPEYFKLNCDCGRNHTVTLKTAVIEAGALSNKKMIFSLREKFRLNGKTAAIYDTNTFNAVGDLRPDSNNDIILNPLNLHADEKATNLVLNRISEMNQCDVLIAVGSGTIHDITRYVAAKLNLPFISIPTAASVDGYVSTVAAMTWNGYKLTMPAVAPDLLIADLNIIKDAPWKLTCSGVGDIIGKYIALADWKISSLITGEYFCEEIYSLMKSAADKVRESYKYLLSGNINAYENMMTALVLSGVAMQLSGNSRPASGAEHHISHMIELGLDWIPETKALHGEKVGVGTLLCIENYKNWLGTESTDLELIIPEEKKNPNIINEIFGVQINSVLEENKNDCIQYLDFDNVINKWDEILNIISKIPVKDEILTIFEDLNASKTLQDIGITDKNVKEKLIYWSPYIRNRLTFSRVCHYLSHKNK